MPTQAKTAVEFVERNPMTRVFVVDTTGQFLPVFLLVLFFESQKERDHLPPLFQIKSRPFRLQNANFHRVTVTPAGSGNKTARS